MIAALAFLAASLQSPEVLTVEAVDGTRATAVLRKPPGEGPFPALVYLHGGLDVQPLTALRKMASGVNQTRFLEAGYVTVTATFRSRRKDPQTTGALRDVEAIVAAVKKRPEVDPGSVVVWGDSGGGSLALELAGTTELCAIAVQEPATVLFTGMFRKGLSPGESVAQMKDLQRTMGDPGRYYTPKLREFTRAKIGKISCPILIVHGDKHVIRKINYEIFMPELKRAGKEYTLIEYPGEPHGFSNGRGSKAGALKFFKDSHRFFAGHLPTKPIAVKR